MRLASVAVTLLAMSMLSPGARAATTGVPTVAVVGDRAGQQDASELSDALTDALVERKDARVIDRAHLKELLDARTTSADGQVTPDTEMQVGRTLGVNYLLVVRLNALRGTPGHGLSTARLPFAGIPVPLQLPESAKASITDSVDVIDVNSSQIVQTLKDDRSGDAGTDGRTALIRESASALAEKLEIARPSATALAPKASGQILDVSGGTVTLSLSSGNGIHEGDVVDVLEPHAISTPSGRVIHTLVKRGTLQIVQVESDYSIAKPIGGFHAVKLETVRLADQ